MTARKPRRSLPSGCLCASPLASGLRSEHSSSPQLALAEPGTNRAVRCTTNTAVAPVHWRARRSPRRDGAVSTVPSSLPGDLLARDAEAGGRGKEASPLPSVPCIWRGDRSRALGNIARTGRHRHRPAHGVSPPTTTAATFAVDLYRVPAAPDSRPCARVDMMPLWPASERPVGPHKSVYSQHGCVRASLWNHRLKPADRG